MAAILLADMKIRIIFSFTSSLVERLLIPLLELLFPECVGYTASVNLVLKLHFKYLLLQVLVT